jgi:hypothetical protein
MLVGLHSFLRSHVLLSYCDGRAMSRSHTIVTDAPALGGQISLLLQSWALDTIRLRSQSKCTATNYYVYPELFLDSEYYNYE